MARLIPFNNKLVVANFGARVGRRLALSPARNPEVASAKMTNPKNGNPQTMSLPPLPNGGISMSDRKTRTSVVSAAIAVIKEKYVK